MSISILLFNCNCELQQSNVDKEIDFSNGGCNGEWYAENIDDSKGNYFKLNDDGSLLINAGERTDWWASAGAVRDSPYNSAPKICMPVKNFKSSSVLLDFDPRYNYQLAGLALRDKDDVFNYLRIARGFDDNFPNVNNVQVISRADRSKQRSVEYTDIKVYLKITREDSNHFTLSYSSDGNTWSDIAKSYEWYAPERLEICLFVYSTLDKKISAVFHDFYCSEE